MRQDFVFFGPAHLAILAAVPVVATLLAFIARHDARLRYPIRLVLAAVLMGGELLFYGYMAGMGVLRFPDGLPLQFCNIVLWMTVLALVAPVRPLTELVWYLGAFGPTLGLLWPQLWLPTLTLPSVQYFIGHAGVLVSIMYLVLSGEARPSTNGVWPAFATLNAIGVAIGLFNAFYATNYMFLKQKPAGPPALMNLIGPWPWYLAGVELLAIAFFCLAALPFRKGTRLHLSVPALRLLHGGAVPRSAQGMPQTGD